MNKIDIYKDLIDNNVPIFNVIKPHQLKEHIDQYVIGQEETKRILCTAVYNHYKRIINNNDIENDIVEIDKSNILLLGQTGSGKSYLIKTIAKFLNVPCFIADATTLTESGYVGSDIETVLCGLLQSANGSLKLAEMGICVIDEIDKIGRKSENPSITRDVSGEGVQQGLLKLLEDSIVEIQSDGKRKHPDKPTIQFNTKNVLFIGMGAFEGIESKIKRRLNVYKVGFNTANERKEINENEILKYAIPQDLKSFGLIPELIGRFPVITNTNPLTEEMLVDILVKPKNAITKQFKELFKMDDCELSFDDDALLEIAKIAIKLKTGARSLRNILENLLQDYAFEIPEKEIKKVNITKEYVIEKTKANFMNSD